MPAGDTQVRYEIGNSLGRLQANRPRLAERVVEVVEYARTIRYVLNAIDGFQDRTGASLADVVQHIRQGRIEVRCCGDRVVVVTP